ncbi:MAG: tripartite tricarboxylate transporter substrate-binding protein [Burkholderiales bacterium]
MLAPAIAEEFAQQVVVENRAGAGSTIGTLAVAKAAPDGHTIGMIDSAFITNPSLMAKLPYDTLKDFTAVVFVATAPLVLVVHPSVAASNLQELIAFAKARPGQLAYASGGIGSGMHLAAEQLRAARQRRGTARIAIRCGAKAHHGNGVSGDGRFARRI